MASAEKSLAAGSGPADGSSMTCSSTGGTSASCSAASTDPLMLDNGTGGGDSGGTGGDPVNPNCEGTINATIAAAGVCDPKNPLQGAPADPPSARYGSSMAFVPYANGEVVLFGGYTAGTTNVLGDTWTFHPQTGTWTQITPGTVPPARAFASMASNWFGQYVVMFGGRGSSGLLSDTWLFDVTPGNWQSFSCSGSCPSARENASMDYDSNQAANILYGGIGSGGHTLGDLWTYKNGNGWTSISQVSPNPGSRYSVAMAFNYQSGQFWTLLFGGGGGSFADAWNLTISNGYAHWTQQCTTTCGASARYDAVMGWDPTDQHVFLFGGVSGSGADLGDAYWWVGSPTYWSSYTPAFTGDPAPSARSSATMYSFNTFNNSLQNMLVMFGGDAGSGETWEIGGNLTNAIANAPTWVQVGTYKQIQSSTPLSVRSDAAMTWDAHDSYVVLFGGQSSTGAALGDTWKYTTSGGWTQLSPSTSPAARYYSMMFNDWGDSYVLLFGGVSGTTVFPDTWKFSGGSWTRLQGGSGTHPSGRYWAMMADEVQSSTQDVLLFGGRNTSTNPAYGDTWTYHAGTWTQHTQALGTLRCKPCPVARYGAAITPDVDLNGSDGLLMFGGQDVNNHYLGDTFGFDYLHATWFQFFTPSAGTPTARSHPSLQFNAWYFGLGGGDGGAILTGGVMGSTVFGESWVFNGNVWIQVCPASGTGACSMGSRWSASITFYGINPTYVLVFGGCSTSSCTRLNDDWKYTAP
ncbi:MAG: hypothetical protein KGJ23_13900 [Euryarchaeota archaeon]|nr:hypothetical protein [Euryarchaeota archaeon]MDE1837691.1 hypothetical protein [Euryarchaeota archaeon]MDE1881791.1 hypothetical protein [Euryarchaeota archaeon]MDE2045979.1 hypothetical protein [Thermoplasmata archaeon]